MSNEFVTTSEGGGKPARQGRSCRHRGIRLRWLAGCLAVACGGGAARAGNVEPLWIGETPRQAIAGWGIAADIMRVPSAARTMLVRESGATFFRLPLEGLIYAGDDDDEAVGEGQFGRLARAAEIFVEHGGREYFTTTDSPPPSMKAYYSKRGHVDLNPNPLMREKEEDYARFVAGVFGRLRREGYPLPFAHSLQDDAGRLYGMTACPWEPEQMARVTGYFHQAFAREKLEIRVAGPENTGYAAALPHAPRSSRKSRERLDVFAYRGKGRAGDEYAEIGGVAPALPVETWMTGWACYDAATEEAAVVKAMQRLAGDLLRFGVTRWTWEAGYSRERTVCALVYGKGTGTKLFETFRVLWREAPPGFRVLPARIGDATSETDEAEAVAFDGDEGRVCLLINAGRETRRIGISALPGRVTGWWTSSGSSGAPAEPSAPGNSGILSLGGESIGILAWKK